MTYYVYTRASAPSLDDVNDTHRQYPPPAEQPPPPYTSIAPSPSPPPPGLGQPGLLAPQVQPQQPQQPPVSSYGAVMPPFQHNNYNAISSLRTEPGIVQCPECGHQVETVTDYKTGSAVVFSAVLLFVFGCHGTCLIPFCCPFCKDVSHKCPACDTTIATFSRLSQNVVLGDS
ncbi:LITAF-like zinc ribbon domain-containing protein [Phascolomyces articulosus]|uniref:LITAF-like zinc ribbon domain-containing protein n=1 Tax=Phascolomyces articulosus TaxID=60185 RepID=A0AAD5PK63_9FUNG|nr:LITAF-like zinc ribbon domain-containing protein [Phascolomyces articulosus]